MPHRSLVDRRTRLRHRQKFGIRDTPDLSPAVEEGTRPENMVAEDFYAYVQFYCAPHFQGQPHMLMYTSYRNVNIYNGLDEDKGHKVEGFQDISVLEHLCTKVTRKDGKVIIVDSSAKMEEHLHAVLRA